VKKAIFIDKDGVIVDASGFPYVIPTDKLLPEAEEGLKLISDSEYLAIIISNQSWVARNRMSHDEVTQVFNNIKKKLKEKEIHIDDFYFCPHLANNTCPCRKPEPGMIEAAAKKHNIDLSQSIMIGDMTGDIELGRRLGMKTVLVKTGSGGSDKIFDVEPDHICDDLTHAAKVLLKPVLNNKN